MTAAPEHGPGLTWLAARVGCTPEELLADPRRLVDALADAERAMTGLGRRLHSDDDAVRADAEREADRLRRLFVDAPDPADRFRQRVLGALRDATERVRSADPGRTGRKPADRKHADPARPDDGTDGGAAEASGTDEPAT
jgi:hypothetical protein